jgi:hypothetical protein
MGVDCSNCRCTNREDEKILIIDNNEKINHSKLETRNNRLETLEKSKASTSRKLNMPEYLSQNPGLNNRIVKLQSMIRKYRDRKTYKAILKKFRVRYLK